MHVVQIWIMHINALKTQLMHKNVQTNPEKSHKITRHSYCSMLTREIFLKAIRGNGYRFVREGGTFPTENHHACCEKHTQTCPKWDKICTTTCWCRSMIACQVSWFSDMFWTYKNFKTKFFNVLGRATMPRCLNFIPISCMGPGNLPEDTHVIFQPTLVHGSMCL